MPSVRTQTPRRDCKFSWRRSTGAASSTHVERILRDLRDLKITAIPEVDSPANVTDAVDDIFGRLPPRREGRRRDRTRDDKAMELTFALARKHDHGPFFQTARRLMCRKAHDPHEFKFMAAVFENYEHRQPRVASAPARRRDSHLPGPAHGGLARLPAGARRVTAPPITRRGVRTARAG